jgi:hypothetical protein
VLDGPGKAFGSLTLAERVPVGNGGTGLLPFFPSIDAANRQRAHRTPNAPESDHRMNALWAALGTMRAGG